MVKYWHFYLNNVFLCILAITSMRFFACFIVALLPELWLYILSYVVFYYAESEMT